MSPKFEEYMQWKINRRLKRETMMYMQSKRGLMQKQKYGLEARNYWGGEQWRPGVVTKQTGPVSYEVDVGGDMWNQNAEQLRPATTAESPPEETRTEVEAEPQRSPRPKRNVRKPERLTYEQPGEPV